MMVWISSVSVLDFQLLEETQTNKSVTPLAKGSSFQRGIGSQSGAWKHLKFIAGLLSINRGIGGIQCTRLLLVQGWGFHVEVSL